MTFLRRCLTAAIALAVSAAVLVGIPQVPGLSAPPAQAAAQASLFNPGNIVSDAVFYDSGAMSVAEVQAFLTERGRNCVAGEQACLKDYVSDTRTVAAETGLCKGYTGARQTAAQIIVGVAQSCGINPQTLLVLLEKEQALVGRTRPTSRAYQIATGFGCPDTAPCNAEYYGFFNQVYRAARQFQIYENNPSRYGYQAGRTNYIQWHPNASCGGTNVFIENQATAALYIYTPYQPNAAAMKNLYGTGDSCSSYGNRNFWRLFTDWFADPRAGDSFVRTSTDPTVWLVSGSNRYRVPDMGVLGAFSKVGPVAVVDAADISRLKEGPALRSTVIEQGTGNVFFVDAGIALRMTSCDQVGDFGASCASLPTMTGSQIRKLTRGPDMTNGYVSTDGRRWYVSGGTKREVFDDAALRANGLSTATVRLTPQGIASLRLGTPVLRDRIVIVERGKRTGWLFADGRRHEIPMTAVETQQTIAGLPRATLDGASIATLPPGLHITGAVSGPDGRRYLLTTSGLAPLDAASTVTGTAASWSAGLIGAFPREAAVGSRGFLRSAPSSVVHETTGAVARPVASWSDLVQIARTTTPRIHVVPDGLLPKLASVGPSAVPPGVLVKSPSAAEVYYSVDVNQLVHVDDLRVPAQVGARSIRTVDAAIIAATRRLPGHLSPVVQCGATTAVMTGSSFQPVAISNQAGLPVTPLGAGPCASVPTAPGRASGPVFVRTTTSPDLYYISGGTRRHVQSWTGINGLTGGAAPTIATMGGTNLATVPLGAPVP